MMLIYEKEITMTEEEYIKSEERRRMREHAESQIRILLNGIESEKRKHYKIEMNREKKINALYDKIAFWSQKLVENKF